MLNVWVSKNVVGSVDRHPAEQGDYVFAYHPTFRPGQEVSLTMPYSLESYSYKNGLHPVFQMNLPEGRLRESIERGFRKRAHGFDQLALLEVVGRSQIGRLRFSNDPNVIDQVPLQSVHELIAYAGTEDLLHDLLERFSGVSGVSGVQPKVLIKNQDEPELNADKAGITVKGATHIVKGWDANEFAPAYDIVTTTPYIKGDSLALTLDGSKSFPKARKLVNFAKLQCNLQPARTAAILEEVAEAVVKTMTDLRQHIKDHPGFEKVGEAMIREWNDGLNTTCRLESMCMPIPINLSGGADIVRFDDEYGR